MYMIPTNCCEVENDIKAIKSDFPGLDKVSLKILRHSSESLEFSATHINNLSLKQGIFTDHLKKAWILTFFKSGNRCDIKSWISVLPAFSRILEKIIALRLINHLEKNSRLTEHHQHFFHKKLLDRNCNITLCKQKFFFFLNEQYVGEIFIDLSRAFDLLSHRTLIGKLNHIRISGVSLQLFRSYLCNIH